MGWYLIKPTRQLYLLWKLNPRSAFQVKGAGSGGAFIVLPSMQGQIRLPSVVVNITKRHSWSPQ